MAIYGTEAGADVYLANEPTWLALTSADKQIQLEEAALWLNTQSWLGSAADAYQDNAWPRSGMYNRNGGSIDSSTTPDDVLNASYELAFLNFSGKTLFASSVTKDYAASSGAAGGLIQNTVTAGKSGGVEVTKKYSSSSTSTTVSTDLVVHDYPKVMGLIGHYLIGGGNTNRLVRH